MKFIIFGDVFGKLGRAGVKIMLPKWRERFLPDVVVANIENISHGKGIGTKQINELKEVGVDIFTGGNHSLEGKDYAKILDDETIPILRPANFRADLPGRGELLWDVKQKKMVTRPREILGSLAASSSTLGVKSPKTPSVFPDSNVKLTVINLIGRIFMKQEYESPFDAADKILEKYGAETPFKILDWHADATSEKNVMGWYLDGRVSAVLGTHSHVPTADAKILPKGTAYISDIGMVGPLNSVIGVEIEPSFLRFNSPTGGNIKTSKNPVETGPIEVNAVYLELGLDGKAVDIKHLREIIPEGNM